MAKVTIKIEPAFCRVLSSTKDAIAVINEACQFEDPRAKFSPLYQMGYWDGNVSFWSAKHKRFPTGLLPRVRAALKKDGVSCKYLAPKHEPVSPDCIDADMLFGFTARDYQYEAARIAISAERGWVWLATNAGKSQPLDSTVYTPSGPKRMGDVRVGDVVLTPTGKAEVLGVFPQGVRQTYYVEFADGAVVEADGDHLWEVGYHRRGVSRLTTKELSDFPIAQLRRTWVPSIKPVQFSAKPVPLDPYLLGVLLGDGCFSSGIRFSTSDREILQRVRQLVPSGVVVRHIGGYDYSLTAEKSQLHSLVPVIRDMGLYRLRSHEKFIPRDYLYNSVAVRMSVLQGILDTDGSVSPSGQPVLEQTSARLSKDIVTLVESLGGSVCTRVRQASHYVDDSGIRVLCKTVYRQHIRIPDATQCFSLSRKRALASKKKKTGFRTFRSITPARRVLCQCLYIDDPRHLYLTDHFIPTHNTSIAAMIALGLFESKCIKTLLLVPNATLLVKNAHEIKELVGNRMRIGTIGAGSRKFGDLTVATAQTIIKGCPAYIDARTATYEREMRRWNVVQRGKKPTPPPKLDTSLRKVLELVNCILLDEAHHASADTWQHILGTCPARFRIGMTGTYKTDDQIKAATFKAYIGPLLKEVRNKELIDRGFSAKPYVFCVTDPSVYANDHTVPKFKKHIVNGEVQHESIDPLVRSQSELSGFIEDHNYNTAIVHIASALNDGGLKPAILATKLDHIKKLRKLARRFGLTPYVVHGKVPAQQRLGLIDDFTNDSLGLLIGSRVFDEGVNIPSIGSLILVSGGKSSRELLQRVGRAVRVKKGDLNVVAVIDFAATNGEYVMKHFLKRLDVYEDEKFHVVDVADIHRFCDKAKQGWQGLLGRKRYEQALKKQKSRLKQT